MRNRQQEWHSAIALFVIFISLLVMLLTALVVTAPSRAPHTNPHQPTPAHINPHHGQERWY